MAELISSFVAVVDTFKLNMPYVLSIIGLLWGIQIINWLFGYRLNIFGLYPRHPIGIMGIFVSPFLHGSFAHLFFNSIPLFVLLHFIMLQGLNNFIIITGCIFFISGILLWLFGRKAIHIGASGVIMGYLGFLLMDIYSQGTVVAVGVGIVCIYYFSSMLFSILPSDEKSSWEGHLFGLISGALTSYLITTFHI